MIAALDFEKMKRAECIIFPDIHGRDFWKKVLCEDCEWSTDTFIFLGDYFDPYPREGITEECALQNWYELMAAVTKRKTSNHYNDFIFLMGNHDAHYINDIFNRISGGCRKSNNPAIRYLLKSMTLYVACEMEIGNKRVLFSHAGVMKKWYDKHKDLIGELSAHHLNNLTNTDEGWKALAECDFYRGGNLDYGSPLWADIRQRKSHENELKDFGYDYQIVGHTQIRDDGPIILDAIADLDSRCTYALTSALHIQQI